MEGAEWDVMATTDWVALRPGQVQVEIHDFGLPKGNTKLPMRTILAKYFRPLEAAGYLLFSIENVYPEARGQYELAFIHKDWTPH